MTVAVGDLVKTLALLTNWHPRIADLLADHLQRGIVSNTQVDELLMSATKLVESSLRDAIVERSGGSVSSKGAQDIIQPAVQLGLLKSSEPLTDLLRWFFGDPRNTSHHLFIENPTVTVLFWLGSTNVLLTDLDGRKRTRTVPFSLSAQQQSGSKLIMTATLPASLMPAFGQGA